MGPAAVMQPRVPGALALCSSTQPPLLQTRPSLSHTRSCLLQTRPSYNCSRFKYVKKHSMLSSLSTFCLSRSESYSLHARRALPGGRGRG